MCKRPEGSGLGVQVEAIKRKQYEDLLEPLEKELVAMARCAKATGARIVVLFGRSWYNRAGVERVMGFASEAQVAAFLDHAPKFERQLVDDEILLFKYWLAADQAEQEARLKERLDDPLKRWRLSPTDFAAREKYQAYTDAREAMLAATQTDWAPWPLVDFNDQKRGRLTLIRDLLDRPPDTNVEPAPLDFPALGYEPLKETYGVLNPIAGYPVPPESD